MGSASDSPDSRFRELRKKAEKRLIPVDERIESLSKKDLQVLVHELQTYKLELEIQNEELRRVQQELQLSRDNYAELYDFAPVGYFTLDGRGAIKSVNLTGASMLGAGRARMEGKPLSRYVWRDDAERFDQHLQDLFRERGAVQNTEFRMRRADGSIFQAELRCAASTSEESSPGLYRIAVIDISARKQAEDGLNAALAELQRSNTELEQFAYVASHDLQEPLRMVTSFLQLIEKKYHEKLDSTADRYIRFAVDGARRMQQLIEGLLAYSRLSREIERAPVDTGAVCAEAIANLSEALREARVEITVERLPTVKGDGTQLLQLFQNLIGNGIKYRKEGIPSRIRVAAEKQGGEWLFSVSDNGIGIESGNQDRIFLLFQRLHVREEYPGTGIGLALCKRIVEQHNGRIWFTSRPGEGSTFFFTLPADFDGVAPSSTDTEKH